MVQMIEQAQATTRLETLRAELEAARESFHQFAGRAVGSGWNQKSQTSAWTYGELLVHLTWALEYLPAEVRSARQGKGMFNLPEKLSEGLSLWYVRWIARRSSLEEICRRYDRAITEAILLLSEISESDWGKGANFYGHGFHSIEDLFHSPAQHLAEHTRED